LEGYLGTSWIEGILSWKRGGRALFVVLVGFPFLLAGCGSTRSLVKKSLDPGSLISKLRADSKDRTKKTEPAAKSGSYPPLPLQEDSPRVRRFIRHYGYKQRGTMRRYLARAEKYLPMVSRVAKENGLPKEVGYLFLLESGANPGARSRSNALGMWQFMPATARSYGLRVDSWVDERLDPEKSTRAAMVYLKDLYGMFGCWRLAFSAYNSGENKLNRVLCQEDADEYEEICSSRRLKRETREFWPRFQAIARIARNPRKFGFLAPRLRPEEDRFEEVAVRGSYSLKTLARLAGLMEDELKELNPALLRKMTPPTGPAYTLRVPRHKKRVLLAKLKRAPEDTPKRHVVHVVHKGDSVWKLVRRYRVTRAQLASFNPDVNLRRKLRKGARLVIPVEKRRRKPHKSRKRKRLSRLD
jgi:membrane-bound lytic murein transglycosylase D